MHYFFKTNKCKYLLQRTHYNLFFETSHNLELRNARKLPAAVMQNEVFSDMV